MNLSAFIRASFIISFGFPIASCSANTSSIDSTKKTLRDSFEIFYIVKYGKEFPSNEEHLSDCYKSNYKPCLIAYNSVI
ncbi:hypothetical protein BGP75_22670 [Motiliproteus sp. MSK22-1]|nr:hypothetical protein BGP75_22670 [Motiliproteus sp. MSK22-1]